MYFMRVQADSLLLTILLLETNPIVHTKKILWPLILNKTYSYTEMEITFSFVFTQAGGEGVRSLSNIVS